MNRADIEIVQLGFDNVERKKNKIQAFSSELPEISEFWRGNCIRVGTILSTEVESSPPNVNAKLN